MSCFFHTWGAWELKSYDMIDLETGRHFIEEYQERRCVLCGKYQRERMP